MKCIPVRMCLLWGHQFEHVLSSASVIQSLFTTIAYRCYCTLHNCVFLSNDGLKKVSAFWKHLLLLTCRHIHPWLLFLLAKCFTFSHICCHSRTLSGNRWHSQITSGLSVSDRVNRNKFSAACLSYPLNFSGTNAAPQDDEKKDVSSYFNVVLFWHGWCFSLSLIQIIVFTPQRVTLGNVLHRL